VKKLCIIGRGTAGAQAAAHFYTYLDPKHFEIEWCFADSIQTQSVGEGSTLWLPQNLWNTTGFTHEDIPAIGGTEKVGVLKQGWGKDGKKFMHSFPPHLSAIHFSAHMLHDYILNRFKDKISIVREKVDTNNIDADYVFDCTGTPTSFEGLRKAKYIPVNAAYVVQCLWDRPEFNYTVAFARPYGWVFAIPLQNRCSVGYIYNEDINTEQDVEQDIKEIIRELNLNQNETPGNKISFNSYWRHVNFTDSYAYSGNASFFLEPLEAASTSAIDFIQRKFFDFLVYEESTEELNEQYNKYISEMETMISLHYFSGSVFNTEFWKYAVSLSEESIALASSDPYFVEQIKKSLSSIHSKNLAADPFGVEYGTWGTYSYAMNIKGLGIEDNLCRALKL